VTISNEKTPRYFEVDGAQLTRPMAALLLVHAEGPRPTRAAEKELQILRALKARKLIRFDRLTRPTKSIATLRGREVIVALLAAQAELLSSLAVE
jgi:hypothetical protein